MKYEQLVSEIFGKAGVTINGNKPYDIQVNDERTFQKIIAQQNLGLGESYMNGWWTCQQIDEFTNRIFLSGANNLKPTLSLALTFLSARLSNRQSLSRASQVCETHYDIGNDLFEKMLDPRMVYTCAYWENTDNLADAQIAKMDMICRKLQFSEGMKVLDIGCGWGSFMKYASEKYGVECIGYTLSKNQVDLGKELCKGLPVTFVLDDYRKITGKFDRIVSIGMFEAVGYKNFRTFMEVVARSLKPDGLMLLHTMGANNYAYHCDPWYDKYIFPNGMVPSFEQISKAFDSLLMLEDVHNIGPNYDKTLMAWNNNFQNGWSDLKNSYSETFKRMWEFYLLQVAGTFRSRNQQLWQIILSPIGSKQINYRDYLKNAR